MSEGAKGWWLEEGMSQPRWEEMSPRLCQFLREERCRCGHSAVEHMDGNPPAATHCLHHDELTEVAPCTCEWFEGHIDGPFFQRESTRGPMSEQPTQEWRIEIGRVGNNCKIFLNGEAIYPCAADLHLEVGQPSTLSLKFPTYGNHRGPLHEEPTYRRGEILVAEGVPLHTYIEIDGRRFCLIDVTRMGDPDDGLFGARRINGADDPGR
jgi:hypothetical protein